MIPATGPSSASRQGASAATMMTRECSGSFTPRVEGTYQAVLDDTGDGKGTSSKRANVDLHRRRGGVGQQLKRRERRFPSDLLPARSAPTASLVNSRGFHPPSLRYRPNHGFVRPPTPPPGRHKQT